MSSPDIFINLKINKIINKSYLRLFKNLFGDEEAEKLRKRLHIDAVKSSNFRTSLMNTVSNQSHLFYLDMANHIKHISAFNEAETEELIMEKGLEFLSYFSNNEDIYTKSFKRIFIDEPIEFSKRLANEDLNTEAQKEFKSKTLQYLDFKGNARVSIVADDIIKEAESKIKFLSYKDQEIANSAKANLRKKIKKIENIQQFTLSFMSFNREENEIPIFIKRYLENEFSEKGSLILTRSIISDEQDKKYEAKDLYFFSKAMYELNPRIGKQAIEFSLGKLRYPDQAKLYSVNRDTLLKYINDLKGIMNPKSDQASA